MFTTSDLMGAMDSPAAAEQQLRLAVRSGAVERARRGLLVSNSGRFEDAPVDPYDVVAAADPLAVLSYHSALEAHGVAHNAGFACQFRSRLVKASFEFRGVRYVPCGSPDGIASGPVRGGASRRVATTREQTVVDCLASPAKAGGAEEAVRSLSAFAYLDLDALVAAVSGLGPSMASRVGWLLSEKRGDWHVGQDVLDALRGMTGSGPYRLGARGAGPGGFSAEWRLILPEADEEVASWITRF
ncbi:MAG: hypothetical protein IJH42_04065 [Atopobiaceae bacterium]|nr:hypothetical protein [Atopobiaceae bacterium]